MCVRVCERERQRERERECVFVYVFSSATAVTDEQKGRSKAAVMREH